MILFVLFNHQIRIFLFFLNYLIYMLSLNHLICLTLLPNNKQVHKAKSAVVPSHNTPASIPQSTAWLRMYLGNCNLYRRNISSPVICQNNFLPFFLYVSDSDGNYFRFHASVARQAHQID